MSTEHVSPQWHLVFDERFEMVAPSNEDNDDHAADIWTNLFNDPATQDWYFDESSTNPTDVPPELDEEWLDDDDPVTPTRHRCRLSRLRQL
jgi:hypothetical protein